MATGKPMLEELRKMIAQLKHQRQKLEAEIARALIDEAYEKARQIRSSFRMPTRDRKRMAKLLAKSTEGKLTTDESRELDTLVNQFEDKPFAMAYDITRCL